VASPDRLVALAILAFSIGYTVLAFNYQLLPFERSMSFKPNTMPLGVGGLGVLFSLAVLVMPSSGGSIPDDAVGWRRFNWPRAAAIVALMVAYAYLLRPAGFIGSTTAFLVCGAAIVGERRFAFLIPIALVAALATWFLVEKALGIYLKPWPNFIA